MNMNSDCVVSNPESTMATATSHPNDQGEDTLHDKHELPNKDLQKEKNPSTLSRHQQQQQQETDAVDGDAEQQQELIPFIGLVSVPAGPTRRTSKARLLSPFAVPSKRYYGNRTRLVHGQIRVVDAEKCLANTKIYFDLQDKRDDELRFPCLMAVKKWKHRKYDIYDTSWDNTDSNHDSESQQHANNNNNKVGTLEKMSFHVGKIAYKLCNDNGVEESRILYRLHSPMDFVMDKVTPGRKCDLVLLTDEGKNKLNNSSEIEDEMKKQKAKDDQSNVRSSNNSSKMSDSTSNHDQPNLLHLFCSKTPDTRAADKTFALDFKGRGRQASTKNAQLVDAQSKVILQMAKVENGLFHVDFRAPCTAFHAFGYALAQLDL